MDSPSISWGGRKEPEHFVSAVLGGGRGGERAWFNQRAFHLLQTLDIF